jgi:hypothetical protein
MVDTMRALSGPLMGFVILAACIRGIEAVGNLQDQLVNVEDLACSWKLAKFATLYSAYHGCRCVIASQRQAQRFRAPPLAVSTVVSTQSEKAKSEREEKRKKDVEAKEERNWSVFQAKNIGRT